MATKSVAKTQEQKLRELVLNARRPVVLRNFQTNWKCFETSLEEWCKKFDEAKGCASVFMSMLEQPSVYPQFERLLNSVEITATEFLQLFQNNDQQWAALQYVRAKDIPQECRKDINFACLGFPNRDDDYSFWLSSKYANTPCHFDTYGCNIVVQIYGSKSWLLLPPGSPLTTTRIPYEESSVYCLENFHSPSESYNSRGLKELLSKSDVFHCILEPNDVLIVPYHWWHYVEAVETSLSVNTWIPLKKDTNAQLEECIVTFLMQNFLKKAETAVKQYVLNPNQLTEALEETDLFQILEHLIKHSKNTSETDAQEDNKEPYQYLSENEVNKLLSELPNAEQIPPLSVGDYENYLKQKSAHFQHIHVQDALKQHNSPLISYKEALINSICSPAVIEHIKAELLQRVKADQLS